MIEKLFFYSYNEAMERLKTAKVFSALILLILTTVIVLTLSRGKNIQDSPSPPWRKMGPDKAKIVVYEYSDFACPACAGANFKLKEIMNVYGKEIQLNFKHYPLTGIHRFSLDAAAYADCAGKQGKFWEFADLLFANAEKWANNENFKEEFKNYARKLNLDWEKLEQCHQDPETLKQIKLDISYGDQKGVDATPTFFVNGKRAIGTLQLINRIQILTAKEL